MYRAIKAFFEFFQRSVIIYPDTVEVLEYLKDNGYKIGILTDVPTGMPTEIIIEDIESFKDKIDYFLSSIDCGFRKPNKRGIEILSKNFRTDIKHIVFVGDEEKDVQAAKNAGVTSILINRNEASKNYSEDIQIKSLVELTTFLPTVS
jgi:putative hydrolase of the HAD superfamily